jgi:hypothetical protein
MKLQAIIRLLLALPSQSNSSGTGNLERMHGVYQDGMHRFYQDGRGAGKIRDMSIMT